MRPPSPPPAPNPGVVAAAQTASSVAIAQANSQLNAVDEDTPEGSVKYQDNGTYILNAPSLDSNGNIVGYVAHNLQKLKRVTTLTPARQSVFDKHLQTQDSMQDWSIGQLDVLKVKMSAPFALSGLPARGATPTSPLLEPTVSPGRALVTSIPGATLNPALTASPVTTGIGAADFSAERDAVRDAILARLEYQTAIERAALITRLANMGIFAGHPAYARELATFDFKSNDARVQAILAAGQEQTRMLQLEATRGGFANAARQQEFQQRAAVAQFGNDVAMKQVELNRTVAEFANQAQQTEFQQRVLVIEFSNKVLLQRFQIAQQVSEYLNHIRERALQEALAERNQPMQEISALLHGGQVSVPQFQQFRPGQIQDVPVGQYIYQTAAIQQQQWQAKVQQQQAMFGALIGAAGTIGGAMLGAPAGGGLANLGRLF